MWRMCVVWDRTRTICAFATVLLLTNLGLNIANFVVIPQYGRNFEEPSNLLPSENLKDSEVIDTYGGSYVGLASAFVSLASNLCATMLVGTKFWYVIHAFSSLLSGPLTWQQVAQEASHEISPPQHTSHIGRACHGTSRGFWSHIYLHMGNQPSVHVVAQC